MNRSRARQWGLRLLRFAAQVLVAAFVLWLVINVPLPRAIPQPLVNVRIPLAILFFILFVGKTLYDTFFYERLP